METGVLGFGFKIKLNRFFEVVQGFFLSVALRHTSLQSRAVSDDIAVHSFFQDDFKFHDGLLYWEGKYQSGAAKSIVKKCIRFFGVTVGNILEGAYDIRTVQELLDLRT
jgi:hypothetical protein